MRCVSILLLLWGAVVRADSPTKPPAITGEAVAQLAEIDRTMVRFLDRTGAPGAAVAIEYKGKLVYARGFGIAEPDRRSTTPIRPDSLFRIASVSKPITLAAVCLLVEQGKLKFDDRVLDYLKLKQPPEMDERWKKITVGQLASHQAGFDTAAGDPMFQCVDIAREMRVPPPAKPEHIIASVLKLPLGYEPGARRVYSNFGYCLLGRIIEKASGKSYESFVTSELLKPLGITAMRLGRTMTPARGEVRYIDRDPPTAPCVFAGRVGRQVPTPYGAWSLEALDAHGGWIASTIDLVRFGCAFDHADQFTVVKGQSFAERFRPKYLHYGSFSGAASMLSRGTGEPTIAVLFNTRLSSRGKELGPEVLDALKPVLADIKEWPTIDLFPKYLK